MSIWEREGRLHVGVMVDGKRVSRKLPQGASQSDAKRVEAELRVALGKQAKQVVIPGDPPMTEVMALFIEHSKSLADGEKNYAALRLGPWAQKYKASQSREFAAHVIKDMSAAYAPASINRSLGTAKKALSIAWERNLTPENYGLRIKTLVVTTKREVFLTVDQVRLVASFCSPQAQAAIWGALLTGARRGELFKLQPEHIGADTITLIAPNTKTKRTRVVPIVPALRPWLEHYPLTITVDGAKSAWRRARVKAGLDHVRFHDLRHSCASILLSVGVDLYTIGKILGHTNTQTTQRYAHLQVAQQRAALDKLSHLVTSDK